MSEIHQFALGTSCEATKWSGAAWQHDWSPSSDGRFHLNKLKGSKGTGKAAKKVMLGAALGEGRKSPFTLIVSNLWQFSQLAQIT